MTQFIVLVGPRGVDALITALHKADLYLGRGDFDYWETHHLHNGKSQ